MLRYLVAAAAANDPTVSSPVVRGGDFRLSPVLAFVRLAMILQRLKIAPCPFISSACVYGRTETVQKRATLVLQIRTGPPPKGMQLVCVLEVHHRRSYTTLCHAVGVRRVLQLANAMD